MRESENSRNGTTTGVVPIVLMVPPRESRQLQWGSIASVFFLAALASSCASTRPGLLDTPAGPGLEALWTGHGGFDRWSEFEGVTFHYRVDDAEGASWSRHITIRFNDNSTVWVEGSKRETVTDGVVDAKGPESGWRPISLRLGQTQAVKARWKNDDQGLDDDALSPRAIDFHLISLRNLVQLPFGLASGGWELRLLISKDGEVEPGELEARPKRRPFLIGPYLIRWDPTETASTARRLESLFYASCHPARPQGVYEVFFDRYETVQGLEVATRQKHFQRLPRPSVPSDPLVLRPREPPEDRPVFVETISDIRFLRRGELEAQLALEPGG